MKHFLLQNGDKMPALGLGTWKSDKGEVYSAIRSAINIGYRHFDCAFIYDNEVEIGEALKDAIQAGEVTRKELWITSKLWNTHHRREDVIVALKQSLKNLQLEYLDLYLIHWPVAQKREIVFPTKGEDLISLNQISLDDTWAGMEECYLSGLSKHIGVSNFSEKKILAVNQSAKIKIEVNQVESHPTLSQIKLLQFCNNHSIVMTAYSPLGSLDRAEAMKAADEPLMLEYPEIITIASSHQCSPSQVLIAWALQRGTSVIPKSTHTGRQKENFDATNIKLSEQEMSQISKLNKDYRYVKGNFFALSGSDYTVENLWN